MTTAIFILSIFVLIALLGKWIMFILLCPFIRLYLRLRCIQSNRTSTNLNSNKQNCDNRNNTLHNIKSICRRYMDGYIRYMQFQVSYIPSHHIRDWIYKNIYLVKMAPNSIIYFGAEIRGSYNLKIGKGAIIGDKAVLDARVGGIEIGENVQLGSFVKLWTDSHDMNDPYFRGTPGKRGPIKIGNRAWLGPNVTVIHSVTIGEGAVIAAGSVVTKDVEPYAVMGGIPARKFGERSHDLRYEFSGDYVPFY